MGKKEGMEGGGGHVCVCVHGQSMHRQTKQAQATRERMLEVCVMKRGKCELNAKAYFYEKLF